MNGEAAPARPPYSVRSIFLQVAFFLLLLSLPGGSACGEPAPDQLAISVFGLEPGPLTSRDFSASYREPEALALAEGGGFYILRRDMLLKYDAAGQEIESFVYQVDTSTAPAMLDVEVGPGGAVWILRRGGRIDRLDPDGEFVSEYNRHGYPISSFIIDQAGHVVAALGLRYSPNTTRQIAILDENGIKKVIWKGNALGRFIAGLGTVGQSSYVAALKLTLGAAAFTDPDLSDREWIYFLDSDGQLISKVILSENTEMERIIALPGAELLLGSPAGLVRISSEGVPLLRISFSNATVLDFEMEPSGDLLILDDSPEHEFVGVKRLSSSAWREKRGRLLDPPVEELFNQWDATGGVVKRLDRALEHERQLSLAGTTEEVKFHLAQAMNIYHNLLSGTARESVKLRLRMAYLNRWLLHQPAEAARLLKEAVLRSPQNPVLHLLLADTLESVPGARREAIASYRAIPLVLASLGRGTRIVQRQAWLSLLAESRLAVLQAVGDETVTAAPFVSPDNLRVPPVLASRLGDISPDDAQALFELFFEQAALRCLEQFGLGELAWSEKELAAFYEAHPKSLFAPLSAVLLIRQKEAGDDATSPSRAEEWRQRLRKDWPGDPCWLVLDTSTPAGVIEEIQEE